MANSRERRERYSTFGRESRSKLTSRWEVVLVLIVVAAGIVITTIAAIKAKEKSDLEALLLESSQKKSPKTVSAKNGTSRNSLNGDNEITAVHASEVNGSTVPNAENEATEENQNSQVTSVSSASSASSTSIPTSSVTPSASSNPLNEMLPEAGSKKVDFDDYLGMVPDYDAEYDSIESRLAPISISAREEAHSNEPDNLPGYPAPNGTSLDTLHQHDSADLAADGAGFLFESPAIVKSTSSSSPSSSLSSPTSSSDSSLSGPSSSSSSPSSTLPKPVYGTRNSQRISLPNKAHSRLSLFNSPDQDSFPSLGHAPLSAEAPSTVIKPLNPQPLSKLAQQPIVTTPSLTLSKSRSKLASLASRAAAISNQASSLQRHSLLQSQTPIIDYNSPLITHLLRSAQHQESALMLPALAHQRLPTIRMTPEAETFANPLLAHTLSSNLAGNFGNIAAAKSNLGDYHARTPASPIFSSTHFGMPAIRSKRSTDNEDQSETETMRPGIENILPLEQNEDNKKMDQNDKNQQSGGENLENGEKKNLSNSNDTNGNDNDLLKSEASGYFAFDDEDPELASLFNLDNSFDKPSPMKTPFSLTSSDRRSRKRRPQTYFPATAQTTKQNFGILGSGNFEIIRGGIYSEDEAKSGSDTHYARGMSETVKSPNSDFDDYNDSSLSSKVPYSTEEYFSNNPVLGFQGYDNFKAASTQQKSIGPNESRRESTASDSSENLHVFVDHELMAAS